MEKTKISKTKNKEIEQAKTNRLDIVFGITIFFYVSSLGVFAHLFFNIDIFIWYVFIFFIFFTAYFRTTILHSFKELKYHRNEVSAFKIFEVFFALIAVVAFVYQYIEFKEANKQRRIEQKMYAEEREARSWELITRTGVGHMVRNRALQTLASLDGKHLEGLNLSCKEKKSLDVLLTYQNIKTCRNTGVDLKNLDLRIDTIQKRYDIKLQQERINLRRAHFYGADLGWSRFDGADLKWSHFDGAGLKNTHFNGADLRWSRFDGAYLGKVHFDGANLKWSYFDGANLEGAHFDDADLRGAHFGRTYVASTDFRRAKNVISSQLETAWIWSGDNYPEIPEDEKWKGINVQDIILVCPKEERHFLSYEKSNLEFLSDNAKFSLCKPSKR